MAEFLKCLSLNQTIAAATIAAIVALSLSFINYFLSRRSSRLNSQDKIKSIKYNIATELRSLYTSLITSRNLADIIKHSKIRFYFPLPDEAFRYYRSSMQDAVIGDPIVLERLLEAYKTYFNFFVNILPKIGIKPPNDEEAAPEGTFVVEEGRLPMLIGSLSSCCSDIERALSALGSSLPQQGIIRPKRNPK